MAFSHKKPPIKLTLTIKEFNLLVAILKYNEQKNSNENNYITNQIDKLLKYSIPYKDEKENDLIDVRYFISEVSTVIKELLNYNIDESIDINYFDKLIDQRNKYNENNNKTHI